jgi:fibronectin type III domain protein/BACON domain-containing protein
MTTRSWTASGDAGWISVSPSTGTITREQDQITVNVNASGLASGTYNGTVKVIIGGNQASAVSVTLVVSGGTATNTSSSTTVTPSILLNPTSLSFSGTAGGANPLAQTVNLSNPTGGTLTWTLTESASWLGLNVTGGTTTTEIDAISASISASGLAAGTYSTAITVAASGASNSPQIIPVTLTLSAPTTNGSASLTWLASTATDLAGYNLYTGTQSGVYGPPVSVGLNTSYTAGNLTGGKTYYFSVTAVNTAGTESLHSNEVYKAIQ